MEIYLVGGAVRDMLMEREVRDRDYVVVGSTPEEMLANGFKQVGADFPVFLHPETGEEYALARRERKSGRGYHGFEVEFDPTVTLHEDLARRDLTINAMAFHEASEELIDPFDGADDIDDCVLRPVSEKAFMEDPVRVLRAIRFLARFGDEWDLSYEIHECIRKMLANGEFKHLTKERVLLELQKAMKEPSWDAFFYTCMAVNDRYNHTSIFRTILCEMDGTRRFAKIVDYDEEWELCEDIAEWSDAKRIYYIATQIPDLSDIFEFLKAPSDDILRAKIAGKFEAKGLIYLLTTADLFSKEAVVDVAELFNLFSPESKPFRFMVDLKDMGNENIFEDLYYASREARKLKFFDFESYSGDPKVVAKILKNARLHAVSEFLKKKVI